MAKTGLTPTDELVRRAVQGDGTAFTELWDTNIESLRAYLVSSLGMMDGFFIDDICSRSFEKAFRQICSYDPSRSRFSTWLKVIARNTALDVLESESRETRRMVSIDDGNVNVSELDSIEAETADQVADLEKRAEAAKEKIDERLLAAYDRIRRNVHNGLAVVTVRRDACGGCYNRIPPQRQADIRLGKKLIVCEYCGRILVGGDEEQAQQ